MPTLKASGRSNRMALYVIVAAVVAMFVVSVLVIGGGLIGLPRR